ncbi:serine endoprotease DegS [Arthrobacter sp. Hiyo4]|nr:serine endoprotease DegS [Arthrobacter sp. Hiyo4]
MEQAQEPYTAAADDGPLDSYSETVMRVAETVTPHVAAIEMTGNRRNGRFRMGAGSAVVFTEDGYLLTNSHVVAGTRQGHAAFADGSRTDLELVGADPLSDLAVVHGRAPKVARRSSAMPRRCAWASWLLRWEIRWAWPDQLQRVWSAAWAVPFRCGPVATGA